MSTGQRIVDSQRLPFTVTQTDDAGNVDFAASAALLGMTTLQTRTAQQYAAQKGGVWTTTCLAVDTASTYRVYAVGQSVDCAFGGTASDGADPESRPFTVTVTDLDGNITWAEK